MQAKQWGLTKEKFHQFENVKDDDERVCDICKTTVYLSGVSCDCDTFKLACLNHFTTLCSCPPEKHVFKYRYSLMELNEIYKKLKERANQP